MGVSHYKMMKRLLLPALASFISCQDTTYCPDGWHVSEFDGKVECIYLGGVQEMVTKQDATVLCAARGGWLVDLDEGRGPAKNNFVKSLLSEHVGQGDLDRPEISGTSSGG